MLQSEEDFIEQYARTLLVEWCVQTLTTTGHIHDVRGPRQVPLTVADLCLGHARSKGWVSKSDPPKVLAKGFSTAAAFLKR
jgi:hypothetical protein